MQRRRGGFIWGGRGKERTCGVEWGELAMRVGLLDSCIFYEVVPLFNWRSGNWWFVD